MEEVPREKLLEDIHYLLTVVDDLEKDISEMIEDRDQVEAGMQCALDSCESRITQLQSLLDKVNT